MLSPLELENKRIITSKRKYDRFEMDEYLDMLFENYKALYNEYEEQKKQIKTLTDGIQYYRSIESTMQKALVLAEKTSKETKDAAMLKAESIEKDAQGRASKILSDAEAEYNRIREKCLALVQQFNNYKAQLQVAAKEQLRLVTSATFEVDTPVIDGQQVSGSEPVSPVASSEIYPTGQESVSTAPAEDIYPENNLQEITPQAEVSPQMEAVPQAEAKSSVYSFSGDTQPLPNIGGSAEKTSGIEEEFDFSDQFEMYTETQVEKPANMEPKPSPEPMVAQTPKATPEPMPAATANPSATATAAHNANVAQAAPVPDKTMILPDVSAADRSVKRTTKQPMSQAETMSILTAETINLGDSIRAARDQEAGIPLEIPEPQPQSQVIQLEPAQEIPHMPANGLDSILQNITIGKKKKQNGATEEDPFEFLGSVDDF